MPAPAVDAPPPVTVTLVAPDRAPAGAPFDVAVVLGVPDGWHIYWENPGQSGLSTDLAVRAGAAAATGPAWPTPTRFTADGLTSFGYAGPTGFVFTVPASPAGALALVTEGTWLLCRDICVRGEGAATATVRVGGRSEAPDPVAPWRDRLPLPFASSGGIATVGDALTVRLPGPGPFDVFPSAALEGAWTPTVREDGGALAVDATLRAPVPPGAHLVVTRGAGADRRAYTLTVTPEAPR